MRITLLAGILITFCAGCGLDGPPPPKEVAANDASQTPVSSAAPSSGATTPSSVAPSAANSDAGGPPDWTPDPELLAKLTLPEPEPLKRLYTFRVPANWRLTIWAGHSYPDQKSWSCEWSPMKETGCKMTFAITEFKKKSDLDSLILDDAFAAMAQQLPPKPKFDLPETRNVNGINLSRYRWKSTTGGDAALQGVVYLAKDDNRMISFSLVGTGADTPSIRLMESAVLTVSSNGPHKP
jgi:hypothetical protein